MQWPEENGQPDKKWSTNTTQKYKDGATRTSSDSKANINNMYHLQNK